MGLDFGLSLGKRVNHTATVDSETAAAGAAKLKRGGNGGAGGGADGGDGGRTRAFTISK